MQQTATRQHLPLTDSDTDTDTDTRHRRTKAPEALLSAWLKTHAAASSDWYTHVHAHARVATRAGAFRTGT